jgi:hypothetical protein
MGDRTSLVLIFAGELLKKAEALLTMGLHPSEIIQGYELARDKVEQVLPSKVSLQFCAFCTSPDAVSQQLSKSPSLPFLSPNLLSPSLFAPSLPPSSTETKTSSPDLSPKLLSLSCPAIHVLSTSTMFASSRSWVGVSMTAES